MRLVAPFEQTGVDIYTYPRDPENPGDHLPNEGSITIPDLHGNTLKLVHFLMAHDVIRFNHTVTDPNAAYEQFSKIYDEAGTLASNYAELKSELKNAQNNLNRQQTRIDGNREYVPEAVERMKKAQQKIEKSKIHLRARFAEILKQFNRFLSQLEVTNTETLVRLIGDDFADRGSSDGLTLIFRDFLRHNGVKVTTLSSNHGIELIRSLVNPDMDSPLSSEDRLSYIGLETLIELGLMTKQEVMQLVKQTYTSTLKLLDYSLTGDGIVLFSHAPIRFDSIKCAADRLGVDYDDSTPIKLAETIENINTAFQFELTGKPIETIYQEYFSFLDTQRGGEIMGALVENPADSSMRPEEIAEWPLVHFTWNRWNKEKDQDDTARPAQHNGYPIQYVHGHDTYQNSAHDHVSNLDTFLGKYPPGKRERAQERGHNITQYKVMVAPYTPVAPTITRETWLGPQAIIPVQVEPEPRMPLQIPAQQDQTTKIPIKRVFAAIGLGLLIGLGFGIGVAALASGVAAPFGAGLIGISLFVATTTTAGALFAGLGVYLGLRSNKKQQLPAPHEDRPPQAQITEPNPQDTLAEPPRVSLGLTGLGPRITESLDQHTQEATQSLSAVQDGGLEAGNSLDESTPDEPARKFPT